MLYNKAIGATASAQKIYIEDVFSTYLYTGNGSTQTITNGIDLSGKGGLVWIKNRTGIGNNHALVDTARGGSSWLRSNNESSAAPDTVISSFNANGYSLDNNFGITNFTDYTYASWTFRKAAKFFDVVTFTTSNTNTNKKVSHSLGSTPGLIIVKNTVNASNWLVYHRSLDRNSFLWLNSTSATNTFANFWGTADPTSTDFGVNETAFGAGTWVAYVFAHDAGGFGDSGNDNVISCGSYTGTSSSVDVQLGWEPQWLLIKDASFANNWLLLDNMRGISTSGVDPLLFANSSIAEDGGGSALNLVDLTATGFRIPTATYPLTNYPGSTYIYIAIRRGPMKTPTDATKVFNASAAVDNAGVVLNTGFPVDLMSYMLRTGNINNALTFDRLRGGSKFLATSSTNAENNSSVNFDRSDSIKVNVGGSQNSIYWSFRRAPGFFDVVAYAGPGGGTIQHNLGVKPQLIIVKNRGSITEWAVYAEAVGATQYAKLHLTDAFSTNSTWLNTEPTASVFSVSANARAGASGNNYIAYLFATCPGVSKVGSYTGTGTTQQINCGFTNGARFVLIKRTDNIGDWFVFDSARGIVASDDPRIALNSTSAESSNNDDIDPFSSGFVIPASAIGQINANGGTFIYLAIA